MTYREKMAIEHPEYIGPAFAGGVWGCPSDMTPIWCKHLPGDDGHCSACWDREIPGTEPLFKNKKENVTMTPTTKKTKAELLDEIAILKKQVADLERYQKYEEMANELFAMQQSFVNSGFTEEQAFSLLTMLIKTAPQFAR